MKAINLDYSLNGIKSNQPKSYNSCPSTHLRTTVTPTGVFICPYWRGKEKFKIGDVNNTKFSKLWKSIGRKEVTNNLDISKECANIHCLRHETNQVSIDIKNNLSNDNTIIPFEEFDRFI